VQHQGWGGADAAFLPFPKGEGRCFGNGLKRIPSRTRREFKVADVIAEPKPEAGSDRHNDYIFITGCKRRHAKTCHHISGTSPLILVSFMESIPEQLM
jgi:hypothetical protein